MASAPSSLGSRRRAAVAAAVVVLLAAFMAWSLDLGGLRYMTRSVADLSAAGDVRGLRSKLRYGGVVARADAAEALAHCGKSQVPLLVAALEDPSDVVRERAAGALGTIGDPSATPALIALLKSPVRDPARDPYVRVAAVRALGRTAGEGATDALLAIIRDAEQNEWVRREAIEVVSSSGDKRARAAVTECVKDPLGTVRAAAVRAIGTLGESGDVPLLTQMLRTDEDPFVRLDAARSLGRLRDKRAVPALIEALQDEDPVVAAAAADVAVTVGGPEAAEAMLRSLQDPKERVRLVAATVLASRGDKRALPALLGLLGSKEWRVRNIAVRALGMLGPSAKSAAPAVEKALKDDNPIVRDTAKTALEALEGKTPVAHGGPPSGAQGH
jgi:HEAT repeat protein